MAYTNVQTLALVDESKGSNGLHWRTREGPIRTSALLLFKIKIPIRARVGWHHHSQITQHTKIQIFINRNTKS
jgi:hypothetical protein